MVGVLTEPDYTVLTASDGYEAVRVLADRSVDLLIADVKMPGLSGFELARQAKLMRPTLLRKPVRAVDLLELVACEMIAGAAAGHAPRI